MPIVADFGASEDEYIAKLLHQIAPRPGGCAHCGRQGCMIGHGHYRRKPRDGLGVYPMLIKRWRCKGCGRTASVLPNFLLRYRQYLLRVIGGVLALRYEAVASWAAIMTGVADSGYPALRTIQRWSASFREQAPGWAKAVQEHLAEQDSRSGWLDAQGEALQAGSAGQALLAGSEHLLAWGKRQWSELAGYGLEKRLEFLWLWGARRGLGRLV